MSRSVLALFDECFACSIEFGVVGGIEPPKTDEDVDEGPIVTSVSEAILAET